MWIIFGLDGLYYNGLDLKPCGLGLLALGWKRIMVVD